VGVRDGLAKFLPPHLNTDERQRQYIRLLVIIISLTAYYFAVISDVPIVTLLLGSYGGVAQIFPLVFCMFYWRRATGIAAVAALAGGILTTVLFLLYPELRPVPLHEGIYGLLVNIILLTNISLATKPESKERIDRYLKA
jgi:SSS family solute:Na+ symporter